MNHSELNLFAIRNKETFIALYKILKNDYKPTNHLALRHVRTRLHQSNLISDTYNTKDALKNDDIVLSQELKSKIIDAFSATDMNASESYYNWINQPENPISTLIELWRGTPASETLLRTTRSHILRLLNSIRTAPDTETIKTICKQCKDKITQLLVNLPELQALCCKTLVTLHTVSPPAEVEIFSQLDIEEAKKRTFLLFLPFTQGVFDLEDLIKWNNIPEKCHIRYRLKQGETDCLLNPLTNVPFKQCEYSYIKKRAQMANLIIKPAYRRQRYPHPLLGIHNNPFLLISFISTSHFPQARREAETIFNRIWSDIFSARTVSIEHSTTDENPRPTQRRRHNP